MTYLLLLRIVGILMLVATLPLATELLVLTMAAWIPAKRRQEDSEGGYPLTVVIPAHNEQALIKRCVTSVLASAGPQIDVLVVAHNCTDATAAEAKSAGARVLVLEDKSRKGKGYALNAGFKAALSGISQAVLVIDADSVVCSRMIPEVKSRMQNGARALQCRYEVENTQDSWRTNVVTLAFHAFNVIRPRGRASLGLSAGVFGNGFAVHRDVLERIPYNAFSIVEDLQYHLDLVRAGYRVEFVDPAVVRGQMPATSGGAKSQRARWEGGRLQMKFKQAPRLLGEVLCGRMRLAEPLLDLLSFSITSQVCLLAAMACLPFAWARWYVVGALAILAMHVATAAIDGPGPWKTLKALATAPAHILWKISISANIWRAAQPDTAWVRTNRESAADSDQPKRRFAVKPIL
jgi:hypothetical protein